MVPFVRACANPLYRRVIGVMGSQMGKTDNLLNVAGARLDDDPAPILYIGPTRSNVEKVVEPRFMKMLRGADDLRAKLAGGKRSSKTYKVIAGVSFRMAWAGSATELASEPAALVLVDERDRMDDDVGGEGDPFELGEVRTSTYPDGTTVGTSTPTIGHVDTYIDAASGLERWKVAEPEDVESQIWRLWQEGSRHEFAVPCPHCGAYFVPRFKLLWWPQGATAAEAQRSARLMCPSNGCEIFEAAKEDMLARGVDVAPGQRIAPDSVKSGPEPDTDVYSLWVSGLLSPWRSFGARAAAYLRAVASADPARIQVAINTGFGELYRVRGDAPDWEEVAALRGGYAMGEVPAGASVLTCGVDVQKDRLYYVVRGWGIGLTSWLVEHGELWGATDQEQVWLDLEALGAREFGGQRIAVQAVDTGYRPGDRFRRPDNMIYAYCRRWPGWARAAKGQQTMDKPLRVSAIDITLGGRTYKQGLQLTHINTDFFKSWVHSRIVYPQDQPGGFHLPSDASDDYCAQMVAESRVVKPSGHAVWLRNGENHYFDCEVLALAGAYMVNLHVTLQRAAAAEPGAAETGQAERPQGSDNATPRRRVLSKGITA